jgi:hypothetical protein
MKAVQPEVSGGLKSNFPTAVTQNFPDVWITFLAYNSGLQKVFAVKMTGWHLSTVCPSPTDLINDLRLSALVSALFFEGDPGP